MLHIALFEPEIPPNTGNIIRLAANTGFSLHLIRPLGFSLDDRRMRRAGLDYSEFASMRVHSDYEAFLAEPGVNPRRVFGVSTRGSTGHHQAAFQAGDTLLFGPETRGLPDAVLASLPEGHCLRIPMLASRRSLNLSNAASIVVYEAWRQLGFDGAQ